MAARRLIFVLLALFAVSIVAAAIAPERDGGFPSDPSSTTTSTTTTTTTTEAPEPTSPDGGESLTVTIEASAATPEIVEGFVGDQLQLDVVSEKAREIEIPEFGLIENASPDTPATFNILLREPGEFAITDAESGTSIGRLKVRQPRGSAADKKQNQTGRKD